jgi:hypothetical protein
VKINSVCQLNKAPAKLGPYLTEPPKGVGLSMQKEMFCPFIGGIFELKEPRGLN